MSRRTVFEWIRAASSAEMTDGCRAFCLQLIPLVDSKTLKCSLPIYQVSTRVSAKMDTIKKYRRQLKALGLIDKGQGWELTVNGERLTSGCTDTQGVHTDTGTSEQWTQGHPKVSTQPPPIYYRSTSLSTSDMHAERASDFRIGDLAILRDKHRPDIKDRPVDLEVNVGAWLSEWRHTTGKDFPWTRWAASVLPYLSEGERDELFDALNATPDTNLNYATAIVSRMCRGASSPGRKRSTGRKVGAVPLVIEGRSEDDDLFLMKISQ